MQYSLNKETPLSEDVIAWGQEAWRFLPHVIRSPLRTSAVVPISPFVVRYLCDHINDGARRILELGPGIGTLTASILSKANIEAEIDVIEKNPKMVQELRERFAGMKVSIHEGDARDMDQMVAGEIDIVFTSIPFSMIPKTIALEIIQKVKSVLKTGGILICYQNRLVADRYIREVFEDVRSEEHTEHFPTQRITIAKR